MGDHGTSVEGGCAPPAASRPGPPRAPAASGGNAVSRLAGEGRQGGVEINNILKRPRGQRHRGRHGSRPRRPRDARPVQGPGSPSSKTRLDVAVRRRANALVQTGVILAAVIGADTEPRCRRRHGRKGRHRRPKDGRQRSGADAGAQPHVRPPPPTPQRGYAPRQLRSRPPPPRLRRRDERRARRTAPPNYPLGSAPGRAREHGRPTAAASSERGSWGAAKPAPLLLRRREPRWPVVA